MNDSHTLNCCETTPRAALERAIEIVGSQTELGNLIGRDQSTISLWLNKGGVPLKMAKKIESITDNAVTRQQLCPELFD